MAVEIFCCGAKRSKNIKYPCKIIEKPDVDSKCAKMFNDSRGWDCTFLHWIIISPSETHDCAIPYQVEGSTEAGAAI